MLKKITVKNKFDANKWLKQAIVELEHNEYHRVKTLCNQIIRALDRKKEISIK